MAPETSASSHTHKGQMKHWGHVGIVPRMIDMKTWKDKQKPTKSKKQSKHKLLTEFNRSIKNEEQKRNNKNHQVRLEHPAHSDPWLEHGADMRPIKAQAQVQTNTQPRCHPQNHHHSSHHPQNHPHFSFLRQSHPHPALFKLPQHRALTQNCPQERTRDSG